MDKNLSNNPSSNNQVKPTPKSQNDPASDNSPLGTVSRIRSLLNKLETQLKDTGSKTVKNFSGKNSGRFDGTKFVSDSGETYSVPELFIIQNNLIEGDILEKVEGPSEVYNIFLRISRKKVEGKVVLIDGEYFVETSDGKFKTKKFDLDFKKVKVGDLVSGVVPKVVSKNNFISIERSISELTLKPQEPEKIATIVSEPRSQPQSLEVKEVKDTTIKNDEPKTKTETRDEKIARFEDEDLV